MYLVSAAAGRTSLPDGILTDSLRGSFVKIGTTQRILAWPLRKDDTHKSGSVLIFFKKYDQQRASPVRCVLRRYPRRPPRATNNVCRRCVAFCFALRIGRPWRRATNSVRRQCFASCIAPHIGRRVRPTACLAGALRPASLWTTPSEAPWRCRTPSEAPTDQKVVSSSLSALIWGPSDNLSSFVAVCVGGACLSFTPAIAQLAEHLTVD